MDECENFIINHNQESDYERLELQIKRQQELLNENEVEESDEEETEETMGQTESKKNMKKNGTAAIIETKGTAMSFGFRKKLNTTPKKLRKLIEGEAKKKLQENSTTVDGEAGGGATTTTANEGARDTNGNAEIAPKIHFEKVGAAGTGTQKKATAPNQGAPELPQKTLPGASNRFGYRRPIQQPPRPASAGITARSQRDAHDNMENNNYTVVESNKPQGLVSNLKRRSKSAHAGRPMTAPEDEEEEKAGDNSVGEAPKIAPHKSITFNLNQNKTIEYQRRQFFEQSHVGANGGRHSNFINSGLHTNAILRPTPKAPAASYAKFTLQTVSLPKPQFPVAISLSATTPTTPGSGTFSPSPITAVPLVVSSRNGRGNPHPLTAVQALPMDQKSVKQMANNTRRGFSGSREISADSGIASMDMALESSGSSNCGNGAIRGKPSPKRSRSRPRNLQMIMSGRHKFEIRDLEDPLSSESNSFVESLALPKLPSDNQTNPLPLSGLIRSNTVLSRETYERRSLNAQGIPTAQLRPQTAPNLIQRNPSDESESIEEEKLYLDRSASEKSVKRQQFKDINTCSSKTSSPGSSIMSSWCNAGESLAAKDCSSLSISSIEDSNKLQEKLKDTDKPVEEPPLELDTDDLRSLNTDMEISTMSMMSESAVAKEEDLQIEIPLDTFPEIVEVKLERPKSLYSTLNDNKFAEIARAGSAFLLEDETSPTVSLVSSNDSDDEDCKEKKHKLNEQLQEKDIDEISPELEEISSPISPGTPTHASHSLSLSDCGNLIDDEIADQPALLFNNESQDVASESVASRKEKTDTPTLMETGSLRSLKSQSKARTALQQAIELSLRTPLSLRKAVMEHAESLDTLSPCDSMCSDDLMMDFDTNSSRDSIERSASIKSRSGSDLNKLDDTEFFSELERNGSDVMQELNSMLRERSQRHNEKDSIIAHLPARATRLLNRSRLQQQCPLSNADSDSSKSAHSARRSAANSRASSSLASTAQGSPRQQQPHQVLQQQQQHQLLRHRDSPGSSDDLMLYDKSFRNAMIQDVLQFKKQLLRLRRILQDTETLNPFENDNAQLFASCGLDGGKLLDDIDLASLTSSTTDDPLQELLDLRRQVVYLQGQVDDRDRTIRQQRNLIDKLEADKADPIAFRPDAVKECINMATQTERTRPLAIGTEGLSRSKPEYTSYTTHFPAICNDTTTTTIIQHQQHYPSQQLKSAANPQQIRRHTIISTTLTNCNSKPETASPRRASIAWDTPTPTAYKPVRITLIGEPMAALPNGHGGHPRHIDMEQKRNFLNGGRELSNGDNSIRVIGNGVSDIYQALKGCTIEPRRQQTTSTELHPISPTVTIV